MRVNENIKRFRKERGKTLEEVGRAAGTSKQTIARYESGEITNIPYDKLVKIANFLVVTPGELMGWTETAEPEDVDTDVLAEIAANEMFMEGAKKFLALSEESKRTILDNIDYLYDKVGH